MDFSLSDDQQLIVDSFKDLMESENWETYFAECDEKHEYPERWVAALCELGFDRITLPEEHGGLNLGWGTLAAVYEVLGRMGAPTYVLYQLPGGFDTFINWGTEEQKEKIFKFLGSGKQMWNSAMTEPGAGSDTGSMKTTYTKKNGKVYLNGTKCYITSSSHVPYLVVAAIDSESETPVYTEWFVDMSKPGISLSPLPKLGLRMDSCNEIKFDNVELDESDMFGREGGGFDRVKTEFDHERFLVALTNYGIAYCAFEDALKYANQRKQFGEAIGRTQLIQLKVAEMAIKIENMRNMVYHAAWESDQGTMTSELAAMTKYYCANAAFSVVDDAMQILGGIGVASEHRVIRFWRDLRVDRVSGGTDEMQILTIGRRWLKQYR